MGETPDTPYGDMDLHFTATLYNRYDVTDEAVDHTIRLIESYEDGLFTCNGVKRHDLQTVDIHFMSDHSFGVAAATRAVDRAVRVAAAKMETVEPGPLTESHTFTALSLDYEASSRINDRSELELVGSP